MPGAKRTRSFVCRKTHEVVTTGVPSEAAFPARMVLTVSFVLSPEIGLVVSVVSAMPARRARRPTSPIVANLMPASRHQDHTTSPSASLAFVFESKSVHRSPRPTFVTIAKRPSYLGTGCARFCF
jgi:hypothetical protein